MRTISIILLLLTVALLWTLTFLILTSKPEISTEPIEPVEEPTKTLPLCTPNQVVYSFSGEKICECEGNIYFEKEAVICKDLKS